MKRNPTLRANSNLKGNQIALPVIDLTPVVNPHKPIGNPNDLIERSHRLLQKFENPYSKSRDAKKGKKLAGGSRFRSLDPNNETDEDPIEGISIREKNVTPLKRKLSIVNMSKELNTLEDKKP